VSLKRKYMYDACKLVSTLKCRFFNLHILQIIALCMFIIEAVFFVYLNAVATVAVIAAQNGQKQT